VRKSLASETEQTRFLNRLQEATLSLEAQLEGLELSVRDLLDLSPGNLVTLDQSVGCPITLVVNGLDKYVGQVVTTGRKRAFLVDHILQPAGHGTTSLELAASAAPGAA
jgi:flagellar motor switch protein FliM